MSTVNRRAVPHAETTKVGKKGVIVIPASLRKRFNIREGSFVIAEASHGGILIRPAAIVPVELFTPERQAELMLSAAVSAEDMAMAREAVQAMGLNPDDILHWKPDGA